MEAEDEVTASYEVIAKVEGNGCDKKSLKITLITPIKRSSRIPVVRSF